VEPINGSGEETRATGFLGELNRATAGHALNDTSSRSHALLSIQIEQDIPNEENPQEQMTRQGKLTFVDLAGTRR
jgi:Kinesin motor domain